MPDATAAFEEERLRRIPLRVLKPADCSIEGRSSYLLKGFIARGDHVVMFGPPGSGKSLLAPHLAYGIAQGRSVFGLRVKQSAVLYVASEDGAGMQARVRALRLRYGDAPAFNLVPDAANLLDDFDGVAAHVQAIKPGLIVLETLVNCFPGTMENEAEAMGLVVRTIRRLARLSDAAVLAVHHGTKAGGDTPRGHGVLNGDADVTMRIEGCGGELRTVHIGKNRNGPNDAPLAFGKETVELGTDADGDLIAAPIAAEDDGGASRPRTRAGRLGRNATVALRALNNVVAGGGSTLPGTDGFPTMPTRGVLAEDWRAAVYDVLGSLGPSGRRSAFNRALPELLSASRIGSHAGWVWPC